MVRPVDERRSDCLNRIFHQFLELLPSLTGPRERRQWTRVLTSHPSLQAKRQAWTQFGSQVYSLLLLPAR